MNSHIFSKLGIKEFKSKQIPEIRKLHPDVSEKTILQAFWRSINLNSCLIEFKMIRNGPFILKGIPLNVRELCAKYNVMTNKIPSFVDWICLTCKQDCWRLLFEDYARLFYFKGRKYAENPLEIIKSHAQNEDDIEITIQNNSMQIINLTAKTKETLQLGSTISKNGGNEL